MQKAIDHFRTNISRVRNLGSIFEALESQTTSVLDLSDVLRAELVLAVSALDHFIHELVRLGMLEAYRGNRPRTKKFLGFQVSLESALTGIADNAEAQRIADDAEAQEKREQWIDSEIRSRNGYRSFQDPERISEAIRLIADTPLWVDVSQRMGNAPKEVKDDLRIIVDRRNQIVHEADMIPSPFEERWPIDRAMVSKAVDMVEKIAEAIYAAVV